MKVCIDCGVEVSMRNKGGRCHPCSVSNPERRAKVSAALHARWECWRDDPEQMERVRTVSRKARTAQTAAHWCPREYADYNRKLKGRGFSVEERKRIIAEEQARDEKRRLAAMTPFERQMERLAKGARLVDVVPMRRGDPVVTLGGVSAGLL